MIHYNMRYRGPYEKEKFILNILQYANLINSISHDSYHLDSWSTLNELQETVDKVYDAMINKNGLCDSIYKKFIMIPR